jgi:hypothetical protein
MRTVRLSEIEVAYLTNTAILPVDLGETLQAAVRDKGKRWILTLSHETAERFRSELTDRLAKVGFNPDYEPTREGRILEDLIDRFSG